MNGGCYMAIALTILRTSQSGKPQKASQKNVKALTIP